MHVDKTYDQNKQKCRDYGHFVINFVVLWAMAYRGSVLWFLFKSAYIYPYNLMGCSTKSIYL